MRTSGSITDRSSYDRNPSPTSLSANSSSIPSNAPKTDHRLLDLLVQFLPGHEFDVPDAELAGQPHVLSAASDGQRELVLAHEHDRAAEHLAEDHFLDLGRLQRVGDQHLHVVAVADDVDPLAGQFVDDVLDSVATDAHARADAVDALIAAATATLVR